MSPIESEPPTIPPTDATSPHSELVQEIRSYLTALYAAAGLAPPEFTDAQVQAALQHMLQGTALPIAEAKGVLSWLTSLPGHAVTQVKDVWSEWLQRVNATDQVLPLRLFQATHEMVGEGMQSLLGTVQKVAKDKLVMLENRYGRTGAILVFTAAVILTPVPVPGTTFAPVLLAEGIRAVGNTFWSGEAIPAVAASPEK